MGHGFTRAVVGQTQVAAVKLKPVITVIPTKTPRRPEPAFKTASGLIHIQAESFAEMSGVRVYGCFTDGKQVNLQKNLQETRIEYTVDAPALGVYGLKMRIVVINGVKFFLGDVRLLWYDYSTLARLRLGSGGAIS